MTRASPPARLARANRVRTPTRSPPRTARAHGGQSCASPASPASPATPASPPLLFASLLRQPEASTPPGSRRLPPPPAGPRQSSGRAGLGSRTAAPAKTSASGLLLAQVSSSAASLPVPPAPHVARALLPARARTAPPRTDSSKSSQRSLPPRAGPAYPRPARALLPARLLLTLSAAALPPRPDASLARPILTPPAPPPAAATVQATPGVPPPHTPPPPSDEGGRGGASAPPSAAPTTPAPFSAEVSTPPPPPPPGPPSARLSPRAWTPPPFLPRAVSTGPP